MDTLNDNELKALIVFLSGYYNQLDKSRCVTVSMRHFGVDLQYLRKKAKAELAKRGLQLH